MFDFDIFRRQAVPLLMEHYHDRTSAQVALSVFRDFFDTYEEKIGGYHPPLKTSQIEDLIDRLDYCLDKNDEAEDILLADYPEMIAAYFDTPYHNCNYRINHFFSGQVRYWLLVNHVYF